VQAYAPARFVSLNASGLEILKVRGELPLSAGEGDVVEAAAASGDALSHLFPLLFENSVCGGHRSDGRALRADATSRVWSKLSAPGGGGVTAVVCLNLRPKPYQQSCHHGAQNEPTHSKQVRT
jgi:hypothetical protein